MTLNAILEIIISLAALFWLMSTGCSFVVEAANSLLLNIRAKALERFVCEMVLGNNQVPQLRHFIQFWRRSNLETTRGTTTPSAGTLADPLGLFSHGLIQALRKPQNIPGGHSSPPSYIPAGSFAHALLDRLLSLSWCMTAMAGPTQAVLDALPLSPRWQQRLQDAKAGVGAGAPLLNAASHLLKEIYHAPISKARADLQSLVVELKSAPVTNALQALKLGHLMPALPAIDSTPQGLRDLLVQVIEAADRAIAALAESQNSPADGDVASLVSPDALWMLAVRKAGESIVHSPLMMDMVRSLVESAPLPVPLREALRPVIAEANFDPDKLRKGIEIWYDTVMERATGWFKRYTTVMLGCIGLVAAVFLNVNTIRVAEDLSKDPALRNAGAAFGEYVVREKGRPQLAQQYEFFEAAERNGWSTRIAALDAKAQADQCVTSTGCELMLLMGPVSRRLLVSGHFYGPAMRVSDPGTPDADYSATDAAEFRKRLCGASLDAGDVVRKEQGSKQITQAPVDRLANWPAQSDCKWIVEKFGKELSNDVSRKKDAQAFWSNDKVVWHPGLGKALRAAYESVTAKPAADAADTAKAVALLKTEFASALTQARGVHEQARTYLDRIPSVGRQGELVQRLDWFFPGGIVLDILGWTITALMISFGASFWFDLLSNLVDRRATGPKPDGKNG